MGFILGVIVGSIAGVFIMCLAQIASRNNDDKK